MPAAADSQGVQMNPTLTVSSVDEATHMRFAALMRTVFDRVDPERIARNLGRFDERTRIYAMVQGKDYVAALFLHPVQIGALTLGGIGGVSVRAEQRGAGLGRRLLERVIADTRETHPALMLWTRIPAFFARFGFEDVTTHFLDDPHGSMPMMVFHEDVRDQIPKRIPREYF